MSVAEAEVEDFLAHYGVKGMRWGVRNASDSGGTATTRKGLSEGQKKALKVGAGVAAITGAAIVTGILAKNGKLPVAQLSRGVQAAGKARAAARLATSPNVYRAGAAKARSAANSASDARDGAKIARDMGMKEAKALFDKTDWEMSVKQLQDEIAQAHRDETKYMKTNSAKSGMGYDARLNEYSPESRSARKAASSYSYRDAIDKKHGLPGMTRDDYLKKYKL